ncbi:MAG: argininosuccinate lyase [Candidatus Aenigmarchaeota archaeon]|nr:argininosuccinate lyase [Candidatus Aenigmarchaeota archaeon]
MRMKLWKKNYNLNEKIEKFTVGNDYLLDQKLVKYDCIASIAHAKMLNKIGILTDEELSQLVEGLNEIIDLHSNNNFPISPGDEDCHTAIENYLTSKYGDVGKKIHTARSRNDQVLTALRLYEKDNLKQIRELLMDFKDELNRTAEKYKTISIPGYTHMQKAMPTTIGLWLNSFADAVDDDIPLLDCVFKTIDKSPLGSAAGFGVPNIKIDREYTADLLGFAKVQINPMYCQMSRGKFEFGIINVLSQVMFDLNKLSTDLILFNMKEFGFVEFPDEFCTGSSIMPQKKNPDVLELIRAKYHVVLGEEFKTKSLMGNLISGYNRDIQLTKESLINSVEITQSCLEMMILFLKGIKVNKENCQKAMSKELYATEEAYELVKKGVSFRDAYREIGEKYGK